MEYGLFPYYCRKSKENSNDKHEPGAFLMQESCKWGKKVRLVLCEMQNIATQDNKAYSQASPDIYCLSQDEETGQYHKNGSEGQKRDR